MDWMLVMNVLTVTGWETWIVDLGLTLEDCKMLGQDWLIPGNDNVSVTCERGGRG